MKPDELRSLFPNASTDFIRSNADPSPDDTRQAPKLERDAGHGALGKGQVQKQPRRRFFVSITSVRKRLLDEDNLCEKYHVDLCRYAGIISGDEAGTTKIEVSQRKARKGEIEATEIEIYEVRQD